MKKAINQKSEKSIAMKVSRVSILVNVLLSVFKFIAGIFAHSGAMISDAIHSSSDVFSTFVVMIGVSLASKKPDKKHPYGHERLECVAAIILSIMLFATGIGIGYSGVMKIINRNTIEIVTPGILALVAAISSIAVKEWMYWYTKIAAEKIHSGALKADAWHHRSDALSSIGALIGICAARLGYPIMDAIASVIICVFILKVSIDIFKDSLEKMVDKSCDDDTCKKMYDCILNTEDVFSISNLNTRMFGSKIYVDVEIDVNGELTLSKAHEVAEKVHIEIENNFPEVKHCMVHVNPISDSSDRHEYYEILSPSSARKVRFENNFCMRKNKKLIVGIYGKEFYFKFKSSVKNILEDLLDDMPEINDSIFLTSYLIGICDIAWFKALTSMDVSVDDANTYIWLATENLLKKIPKSFIPVAKKAYIKPMIKKAESQTEKSKNGTLPQYDWNVEYKKIDDNCFQLNTYECGLKKLCKKFDTLEMLPSLCRMDYLTSHYLHCGFERDKTLGDGDELCNNTFYIKGECSWSPEKGFVYRK